MVRILGALAVLAAVFLLMGDAYRTPANTGSNVPARVQTQAQAVVPPVVPREGVESAPRSEQTGEVPQHRPAEQPDVYKNSDSTESLTAEAPPGWYVTQTFGLVPQAAAKCKGKIMVDVDSPACRALPPAYAGGPTGRRCPNKCVP